MFRFRKRDLLRRAVNRRARGEDESLNTPCASAFEQMQSASDVRVVVELRLLNRWPNSSARSEMKNRVEVFLLKNVRDFSSIAKIDIVHGNLLLNGGNVPSFDLRIVIIVKVVEDRDVVIIREQSLDQMGADKPRAAGDENFHRR